MNWWTDKSVAKWNPSLELSLFKNLILSGHVQKFDVAHACMHNGMLLYPNLFIRVANVMFIEYETTDPQCIPGHCAIREWALWLRVL